MEMHWRYLFFAERLIYVCFSLWLVVRVGVVFLVVFSFVLWVGFFERESTFSIKSYLNRIGSNTTHIWKPITEGPSLFLPV